MRYGETLEQERARKAAEAALPGRVDKMIATVQKLKKEVIAATEDLQKRRDYTPNKGGEKSGLLSLL